VVLAFDEGVVVDALAVVSGQRSHFMGVILPLCGSLGFEFLGRGAQHHKNPLCDLRRGLRGSHSEPPADTARNHGGQSLRRNAGARNQILEQKCGPPLWTIPNSRETAKYESEYCPCAFDAQVVAQGRTVEAIDRLTASAFACMRAEPGSKKPASARLTVKPRESSVMRTL